MAKITICGAPVLSRGRDKFVKYKGKKLYFCNEVCIDKFKEDPVAFIKSRHTQLEDSIIASLLEP